MSRLPKELIRDFVREGKSIKDILIASVDGLNGFDNVFPIGSDSKVCSSSN